ncbi:MAG TPA: helix-turn-helix transcriptional regulator [Streptosporangiaceae bacterium]|nr:helix-turn-helix transcriptional regulator [Streptosporangiaceae bacterium]
MKQNAENQLGNYLKRLREERGLSIRGLARQAGIHDTGLVRIERGDIRTPRPEKLRRLAMALEVPLADLLAMAGYVVPYDLPSLTPYLRARYGHLPEASLTSIDNYLKQLIDEHDLDPRGPNGFEDEASESAER